MGTLIEVIKRIGIFMIAAQALVHFAPGQKYEKYMKLIVGIVILFQFIKPVYALFNGTDINWSDWDSQKFLGEYEGTVMELAENVPEGIDHTDPVGKTVIKRLEEEIKSRLNEEIMGGDYQVSHVKVSMKTIPVSGEDGMQQYELDKVRVIVRRVYFREGEKGQERDKGQEGGQGQEGGREAGTGGEEKIQIPKIKIEIGSEEAAGKAETGKAEIETEAETAQILREQFCIALGMEEEQMEVSVYGEVEGNVR